uniref:lysozyme n=1 Tax=Triatoma infestans TaxID=30076 RepID=A9X7P1_TRIIF|nr:lysozyme 2 [Triatoma infestans]
MKAVLLLCLVALLGVSEARVFTRCELARELLWQGIPRGDLPNWICLIETVSGRDTAAITGSDFDGVYYYGLFQISDRYWCMHGEPGHGCSVKCEDLLSDDITASVKCALLIKNQQGWNSWYLWRNQCKGQKLPNVDVCF